jgi:hypothetical protein
MTGLNKLKTTNLSGARDDDGGYVAIPFIVSSSEVKAKIEPLAEDAILSDAKVETVRTTRIVGLEKAVSKERIENLIMNGSTEIPVVIRRSKRYYVVSGLETLVAAKVAGNSTVPVKVYKPD